MTGALFALMGFIEFTPDFDRCLFHGLELSLFTLFPVRQFEATSLKLFTINDK